MCYAILRVKYKAASEQPALITVEEEKDFDSKVEEVINRPEVQKVVWFFPVGGKQLVSRWETFNPDYTKE